MQPGIGRGDAGPDGFARGLPGGRQLGGGQDRSHRYRGAHARQKGDAPPSDRKGQGEGRPPEEGVAGELGVASQEE